MDWRKVLLVLALSGLILGILIFIDAPRPAASSPVTATPIPITSTEATGSGMLQIKDTLVGTGREVKSGDTVKIHYTGTLENGTKFDSSYDRNTPYETQIGTGAVIKGWDQGVVGMKVGGKRHLVIPPSLGYGNQASGKIPANSTLIFDVELVDITSPQQ